MMHMLRRIFAVLLVLAALLSCAFADDSVEPCADVTFLSATCSLGMDKVATFTLMTDILAGRIVVTNAWLEQQSNGRWVYVKTLAVPATIATNTIRTLRPSPIPARLRPEARSESASLRMRMAIKSPAIPTAAVSSDTISRFTCTFSVLASARFILRSAMLHSTPVHQNEKFAAHS